MIKNETETGEIMRYLGSKIKLLSSIDEVIKENNIEGETFADLFAGTGCVGDFFKDRYQIISNDFLFYSYVMNRAKLKNDSIPKFDCFRKKYKSDIFEWLNTQTYIPDDSYFIYLNYTPIGNRMFFTEENGIKIDGIRQKIEELRAKNIIDEEEYYYLIASMMESITKVSNISGTYEAFFKFWDSRAEKDFDLQPLEINEAPLHANNLIFNEDTNKLVREIKGDIAYIDPPYTVTQYISAYHMFETLARYDYPTIKGVGGKRGRGDKNSLYAQRTKAKLIFEDLFRQIQFKHILISYSNQGLVPIEELCELASNFAVNGAVKINHYDYREYQNHRSSNKRNGENLNEVIIYFEKDMQINKSPINYSGSKDTLVPDIIKALPANVDVFVDAMGGAFNVGANITALNKVVYNEMNPFVYELVSWMVNTPKEELINAIEKKIEQFGMKKADENAYKRLRDTYNAEQNPLELFVLHMYSFQNMIRFNGSHKFNTPIGVAGYSDDMKQRILDFKVKAPLLELLNIDYVNLDWDSYPPNTVFYFDPPYYITSAAYNDGKRGMKGWGLNEEVELLNTLKHIDELGHKFILSNVIRHKEKEHTLLIEWAKENNFRVIDAGVSGWRYAKNEVMILNY